MRIRVRDGRITVRAAAGEHRPVVVTAAGLEIALTPPEALTLADRLVDAVESRSSLSTDRDSR